MCLLVQVIQYMDNRALDNLLSELVGISVIRQDNTADTYFYVEINHLTTDQVVHKYSFLTTRK